MVLSLGNFLLRLQRTPFRVFVHPSAAVDALIREAGLRPRYHRDAGFWQVAVYSRPS